MIHQIEFYLFIFSKTHFSIYEFSALNFFIGQTASTKLAETKILLQLWTNLKSLWGPHRRKHLLTGEPVGGTINGIYRLTSLFYINCQVFCKLIDRHDQRFLYFQYVCLMLIILTTITARLAHTNKCCRTIIHQIDRLNRGRVYWRRRE